MARSNNLRWRKNANKPDSYEHLFDEGFDERTLCLRMADDYRWVEIQKPLEPCKACEARQQEMLDWEQWHAVNVLRR